MKNFKKFLGILALLISLSACASPEAAAVPTVTPSAVPPTRTPASAATTTPAPTLTPRPTVTPIVLTPQPLHFDHTTEALPADVLEARAAEWITEIDLSDEMPVEALRISSTDIPHTITPAQAEEDVRYVHSLLKHGYAGYGYFNQGGRIDEALEGLILEINEMDVIYPDELAEHISESLSFVADRHMSVGGYRVAQHQDAWTWDGIDFYKEGDRYWYQAEDGQRWLEAVNEESPGEYLKLSLNAAGDPVYRLWTLSVEQPDDFRLTVSSEVGEVEEIAGAWQFVDWLALSGVYERTTRSGIPIIAVRSFDNHYQEELTAFQQDAYDLRDEPIIIVDIRGNGGGSSNWPATWVKNLTGVQPVSPFASASLQTQTSLVGVTNATEPPNYQAELDDLMAGRLMPGWTELLSPGEIPLIPNPNQLIVVLVDRGVASSGESFVGYLRQVENVVFVGENTGGALQIGNIGVYALPNSHLQVRFGMKLFLPADLRSMEAVGYMPDIWVAPDQALPSVMAAIEKGWLQPPGEAGE